MEDVDLTKDKPADHKQIDLNNRVEVEYWKKWLSLTEEDLRASVQLVGPRSIDVRKLKAAVQAIKHHVESPAV